MKIKFWDILSFFLLILLLVIGGLILQVYRNPYAAVNPFPPPTVPAKLIIPSWTTTPRSMPATWTLTPRTDSQYQLASTSTIMPTATYNILYPVIRPTRTFTKTAIPATNTPATTATRTATKGTPGPSPTATTTRTTTRTPTRTLTGTPPTPTLTYTPYPATSTATATATATETPAPQPTAIAFSVDYNGDGYKDLVTMSSNGVYTNMIRAGSSGAEPILTDWSPDGEWLLFHSGNIPQVKKIRTDGSDETFINNMGFNTHDAVYSPDGNWILFVQGSGTSADLWRMNSSGSLAPQRLTDDSNEDSYPDWSPDGHSIVFTSIRSGQTDLYLLDLNTGPDPYVVTRLTTNSLSEYSPQFVSANQIVYMVYSSGQYDIYIADITNMAGATNLTNTSAENEKYPALADGKIIYIKQDGSQGVYTMNLDGSGKTRLNENYRYAVNPRWVP
ncbi:MAG: hypothetical protein RBT34_07965 [Anaerolineaceae bacterium]|jgi:Tol biopolymer transport system component|nr:hypothetical protein [Anaerolineaceae bacterium]